MEETACKSECPEITLRPMEITDLDDFMEWASDERVTRFSMLDTYTCRDKAADYINNIAIPHPWLRVICLENRAIGSISVTANSGNDSCRGLLGYVLTHKYWGKGIATKAVKMVASTIFSEWPHLERLEAFVDVDDRGSQRVLEKCGFLREGVLRKSYILKGRCRDFVIYSLLSTDSPSQAKGEESQGKKRKGEESQGKKPKRTEESSGQNGRPDEKLNSIFQNCEACHRRIPVFPDSLMGGSSSSYGPRAGTSYSNSGSNCHSRYVVPRSLNNYDDCQQSIVLRLTTLFGQLRKHNHITVEELARIMDVDWREERHRFTVSYLLDSNEDLEALAQVLKQKII